MRCGGLRRTPNSKILFPQSLYIGVTLKFTWGFKIQDLVPPPSFISTVLGRVAKKIVPFSRVLTLRGGEGVGGYTN